MKIKQNRTGLKDLVKFNKPSVPSKRVVEIIKFVEKYPQLRSLSFNSLLRIINLKDSELQMHAIDELLYIIDNPKISDYRVRKVILNLKQGETK
jgi:hypothetical protein